MRVVIAGLMAAVLGALFTGCSSSSSSSSSSSTGGSSGTSTGSTTGTGSSSTTGTGSTGGTTTGTGGTTTGSSTGSQPYEGFVIFGEVAPGSTQDLQRRAGGLYTTTSLITCASGISQGGCCYLSAAAALDAGSDVPPDDVSAGTITLDDGRPPSPRSISRWELTTARQAR